MTQNAVGISINAPSTYEVVNTKQPCFLGILSGADSNVTGDGTIFTMGSGNAYTEIVDQNADFNTNGTFTCPITGVCFFCGTHSFGGILAAHTKVEIKVVTSNLTYICTRYEADQMKNSDGEENLSFTATADMDAADTATFTLTVSNGTLVVDTTTDSFVSGALLV